MENILLGKLLDILIQLALKSIGRSEIIPLLKTEVWFHSDESSNPQLFYINVTNRSSKDFVVDQALLMKRNKKARNPIIFVNAELFVPSNPILKKDLNHTNIANQFLGLKPLNDICIKAKESIQLVVNHQMTPEFHEHWTNFEFNIIPGFISEDGRVFPSWRAPKYQWEVVIKDEMNLYWTIGQEMIPFQIYLEKYRRIIMMRSRLERGENIGFADVFIFRFGIFKKQIKYLYLLILIKLGIKNCIPEQL